MIARIQKLSFLKSVGIAVLGVLAFATLSFVFTLGWGGGGNQDTAEAQLPPPPTFQYVVKFVCVKEIGPEGRALLPGKYRTVINIHNPHDVTVQFNKKAVIARSQRHARGAISSVFSDVLAPDEALGVDCRDILNLFGGIAPPGVGEGSLVVTSLGNNLDVSAVYTWSTAVGNSIDVVGGVRTNVVAPPPPPPTIDSFTATPATIVTGDTATLAWTTTNATSVVIDNGGGTGLPANGSTSVSPIVTTTYTLTATGLGGTAMATVTVTVTPPPPAP